MIHNNYRTGKQARTLINTEKLMETGGKKTMTENTIINTETVELSETETTETTTENGKKELTVKEIIANFLTCLMPYLKAVVTTEVTVKRANLLKKACKALNILYRANKVEYWETINTVLKDLKAQTWINFDETCKTTFAQLYGITLEDFDIINKCFQVKYRLAIRYEKPVDSDRADVRYMETEFTDYYTLDGKRFGNEPENILCNNDILIESNWSKDSETVEDFDF